MALDSIVDFFEALSQYRVLAPEQLDEVAHRLWPQCREGKTLARELLQRGWLTAFQVNKLFQGRGQELLLGQYVLLERLGEGGMGQVFKARHHGLQRVVALKVVRKDRLDNPAAVRRFFREIEAAAQVSHPNIVHAYDAGEAGGAHFFTMEYVEGTDLARLVKQSGPLPVAQACEYVRQAALGLQHAHERGLVHRDVKPSNLLLSTGGVIKVLDLGLARLRHAAATDASSTLTQEGATMGTPDYIAPEQARSARDADIRADLYSLGCTLYYLLTGKVPFPGGTLAAKLVKHQRAEPTPVEQLRPDVPPAVGALVRKLMAKRPEDRYQTPAEFAAKLAEDVRSLAAPAAAPPPPIRPAGLAETFESPFTDFDSAGTEAASEERRRLQGEVEKRLLRRWLLAGGGALLAVALASLVVLVIAGRQVERPADPTPPGDEAIETAAAALLARAADRAVDRERLRDDVVAFRTEHPGTPQAQRLGDLLAQLPSPLDRLDPSTLPAEERFDWQPKELVAVLGEHRGRQWGAVRGLAYSPDGRVLVSGGDDHLLHLWDPATLRERAVLAGHKDTVRAVAFAPRPGRLLASGSADGTVRLWDLGGAKPKEGAVLKGHPAGVTAVAFSPDGRALASAGGDNAVRLWDVAGEAPREGPVLKLPAAVNAVAFSPDGAALACGCNDGTVRLWDLTGALPKEKAPLKGKAARVLSVVFTSRDGRKLASGTSDGLEVWDLSGPKPVARNAHTNAGKAVTHIDALALSPDGKTLATPCDFQGRLWLWDLSGGVPKLRSLGTFWAQATPVLALAFAPDGRTLALGTDAGQVRLLDVTGPEPKEVPARKGHWSVVHAAALSPDGRTLASGGEDLTARLWDLGGAAPRERADPLGHGGPVTALAFAPDGRALATATALENQVWLWDLTAAKPQARALPGRHESTVAALAFSPDGRRLAAAGADSTVRMWALVGDAPQVIAPVAAPVPLNAVSFSPDGRALAAGGDNASLRLWHVVGVTSTPWATLDGHQGAVTAVTFAPDGQTLASGGLDATVRLWDLAGAKPSSRVALQGHKGGVTSVAFAPDGKTIASAAEDGGIILWDAAAARKVRQWQLPGRVTGLAFPPDGRHLALIHGDGTICVLRLAGPTGR